MPRLREATLRACAEHVPVPAYDRRAVTAGVVHLGVGGFHRAHQAVFHERLLSEGHLDWGICGVGVLPADRPMRDVMAAQDGLYTLVVKHPDGTYEPRVIGAIVDYLFAPDDRDAVVERMAAPSTRIVSMTITEGAYGAAAPGPAFALLVDALVRRRERGLEPFTVMSCDNLQGNGGAARRSVLAEARGRDERLATWIAGAVTFPDGMVDRITPGTTDEDRAEVRRRFGVEDAWPVVCEPFIQWVLEDAFVAGRPPYADVGVQLVGDVEPYERIKVRLLNGGHQALGFLGFLCGSRLVHEAAADPVVRRFVRDYMRREARPTLPPVPGIDVAAYEETLLERFANPEVRDTLARLCAYTSDRIPTFVVPVIRERLAAGGDVRHAATVVAAWARYATGVDDAGEAVEVLDNRREDVQAAAAADAQEPGAFLSAGLVGDVADDPRFASAYREAAISLRERGPRATLEALAATSTD